MLKDKDMSKGKRKQLEGLLMARSGAIYNPLHKNLINKERRTLSFRVECQLMNAEAIM